VVEPWQLGSSRCRTEPPSLGQCTPRRGTVKEQDPVALDGHRQLDADQLEWGPSAHLPMNDRARPIRPRCMGDRPAGAMAGRTMEGRVACG
jgi:hypothetical protein